MHKNLKYLSSFLLAIALCAPSSGEADVILPREGMQYFTTGLTLNPGLMYDTSADEVDGVAQTSPALSGMGEIGVTQVINRHFFMGLEAGAGLQWFDAHRAARNGQADPSANFAWEVGLVGSWLPFGDETGVAVGAGMHYFQAHLSDAPMQILGGDLRVGRYLWSDDEKFVLLHAGYSAPLIQGLSRPDQFTDDTDFTERNWTFHRFTLGFQYGF